MTEAELYDFWTRWMHRKDIAADLDTVYLMASTRIAERLMSSADLAAILENSPRMFMHAGLAYLHELAEDDQGQARELGHFEVAAKDYSFAKSLSAGLVKMEAPYGS